MNLVEFLEEFFFIANEEDDEELQSTFEEMYQKFINVDKVGKDLKMMIKTLSLEDQN